VPVLRRRGDPGRGQRLDLPAEVRTLPQHRVGLGLGELGVGAARVHDRQRRAVHVHLAQVAGQATDVERAGTSVRPALLLAQPGGLRLRDEVPELADVRRHQGAVLVGQRAYTALGLEPGRALGPGGRRLVGRQGEQDRRQVHAALAEVEEDAREGAGLDDRGRVRRLQHDVEGPGEGEPDVHLGRVVVVVDEDRFDPGPGA
jgi:hypothetical protein